MEYLNRINLSLADGIRSIYERYNSDARHHQIAYQSIFLIYGVIALGWSNQILTYLIILVSCLLVQGIGISLTTRNFTGLKSALISALSLCLMFKANSIQTYILVAVLSIAGKYMIRYKGVHIFNPTNFGIVVTILITGDAWLSPGLWGSGTLFLFLIGMLGMLVLNRVQRLDSALTFLLVFSGLHFLKQVVYLGWELDVFFHHISSGTLLLFTFFMITDPVTTPRSRKGRIIWASTIGIISFLCSSLFYIHTAPIWVLFFISPLTMVFNHFFKGERFNWNK